MAEYVSTREWWRNGLNRICFTMLLWTVLAIIMYLRVDVQASIEVHDALVRQMKWIVADTRVSDFLVYSPSEMPVPCRCSCRNSQEVSAPPVCDDSVGTEVLDLLARLPPLATEQLFAADGARNEPYLSGGNTSWDDISSPESAFFWFQHGLLPALFRPSGGRGPQVEGFLLRRSLTVGGIRVRQTRLKALPACDVAPELQPFYPVTCSDTKLDDAAYGLGTGSFTSSTSASGDPVYDAYFDVVKDGLAMAMHEAESLRNNSWISELTQSVDIDFVLLNAEARLFAWTHMRFKFESSGAIDSTLRVHTVAAMSGRLRELYVVPEVIWLVLMVVLFIKASIKLARLLLALWRSRDDDAEYDVAKGKMWVYIYDPWNWVDWVSILLGLSIAIFWNEVVKASTQLSEDAASVPRIPWYDHEGEGLDIVTGPVNGQNVTMSRSAFQSRWLTVVDDSASAAGMRQAYLACLFCYTSVLTVRLLRGFLGQQKLAIFQLSIGNSFWDVMHFLFIFMPMFFNFVLGGIALFGVELEAWSSWGQAISTCVRMLLGSYQFEDMYEVAPFSATVWYWLFLTCLVFVMLNFLTAIMIEHVVALRTLVGPTPTILEDAKVGLRDLRFRCFEFMPQMLECAREGMEGYSYTGIFQNPLVAPGDGCDDPGTRLVDSMMDLAELKDWVKATEQQSSLGLKLARRRIKTQSVMSMEAVEGDAACEPTTEHELAAAPCSMERSTATYILEEAQKYAMADECDKTMEAVDQVRSFVDLLRKHKRQLDHHCEDLEDNVAQDCANISKCLDRMEGSIRESLEGLQRLRAWGVDTLAPVHPGQASVALRALARAATLEEEGAELEAVLEEDGEEGAIDDDGGASDDDCGDDGDDDGEYDPEHERLFDGDIPVPALLN